MTEVPEKLLIPKNENEQTSSSPHAPTNYSPAPEKSPNIKERLNLHVKRRLQQEPLVSPIDRQQQHPIRNEKQKEPPKTRRPYQKRADKTKTNDNAVAGSAAGAVRKYKRQKARQLQLGSTAVGNAVGGAGNAAVGSGAVSDESTVTHFEHNGGDDDVSLDGAGHEAEARCAGQRDKDKCPDVLSMVLSLKKRALMQDPEVHEFLCKIMNTVKN